MVAIEEKMSENLEVFNLPHESDHIQVLIDYYESTFPDFFGAFLAIDLSEEIPNLVFRLFGIYFKI